jgi:hypothetical protein
MRLATITVSAAVLVMLSGCAGTADDTGVPVASDSPSTSAAPTEPSSPSASATPTAAPESEPADASSATCDNLLDPATIEKFTANGAEFSDNDKSDAPPFSDFVDYGGISCVWGASLNVTTAYAYGPITDAQSAKQQKQLKKDATKSGPNENGGTYYELANGEANEPDSMVFVFSPKGYWAMSFDNGGGPVIEEVVANAPVFY